MPTFPTLPRFASGATGANLDEPPDQKKTSGWAFGEPAPYNVFNWLHRRTYECLLYLMNTVRTYNDLGEAAETAAVGDTFIVDEDDKDQNPGSQAWTVAAGATVVSVAVSGQHVLWATAAAGTAKERDGTTAIATFARTNAGNIVRIVTNGTQVAMAYGQFVECYTLATGASLWSYDHGAAVRDVAIDGVRVYLAGVIGTGSFHVRALAISNGAALWSYKHSNTGASEVRSICTTGRQVIFIGDVSSYTSGATLRSVLAANGNDFDAETGGTADSSDYLAWNAVTDVAAQSGLLATDGASVYVGFLTASAKQLEVRGLVDGAVRADIAMTGRSVEAGGIAVDGDLVIVGTSAGGAPTGTVEALDKKTLSRVWRRVQAGAGRVASDGCAVFCAETTNAKRIYRGNRPRIFQRVSPASLYRPYRLLLYTVG